MGNNKVITLVDGYREVDEVELVCAFKIPDFKDKYIIYTKNEKDKDGKTKLQIKEKNKEFRNVSFKDFAVLARTSSEMEFIEKALKNSGIPYLRYKDKKLFLGRECAHWICLLKAINALDFKGRNRNILKRALFTNFFGLSLEKINSEYVNKDDINEVALINKWKQLLYEYKY